MKPNTRLSSAVFQLTPTRTRCDLIIIANEKKEKIASGLLNPFLSHLKTAQDQIAKGGYSILLEPKTSSDAAWFTKATLERFVRFVSTPEILERVYTIETEILQIEEAIVMQGCNDIGQANVEDNQEKPKRTGKGNKSLPNLNEEKAMVLYKPEAPHFEATESCSQEGNSKVQLLKILETRKTVLQKEQGMAFARAVAAGFDIDHMAPLVSFSESFGAMRLLEACSRFMDLWKSKHESGQWLDVEASEVLPSQSDFSALNASGIIFSGTPDKRDESNHELTPEINGNLGSTNNGDNPALPGQQEYFHGQFPLVFPSWPVHTPPGSQPQFPAYPVQGTPYYQVYTGNGPFFQPPHWPMDHPPNFDNQSGQKRQSIDDSSTMSENDIGRTKLLHDTGSDAERSYVQKHHKKFGGSNKKQSGMVVIKNINYITSKEKKSGLESNSDSNSNTDGEYENSEPEDQDAIHQSSKRSSKDKGSQIKSFNNLNFNNGEVSAFGKETEDTNWQAFQNCLLRGSDEDASVDNKGMFSMEKDIKRRANTASVDPLARESHGPGETQDRMSRLHRINDSTFPRLRGSGDEVLSRGHYDFNGSDDQMDMQFAETHGRKLLSRAGRDDFIVGSRQTQLNLRNSSNLQDLNYFEGATNKMDEESSHGMGDENFIVPFRSMSIDQVGSEDRSAIDIRSEIPSRLQNLGAGNKNKVSYEPDGLSLIPERGTEKSLIGYDLALDYEMQVCAEGSRQKGGKQITDEKGGLRKPDKDRRLSNTTDILNKQRTGGPIRKGKSSKMNPVEDARARAEKLRSYKADLQKMKKEKEADDLKRIEALKLERQKRIAARGSSTVSAKPSSLSPQIKQLPAKLSSVANRGSKFSDAEPGSSSPLQRTKIRTSPQTSEPLKASKASKLSEGGNVAANRLTRSSSSLSEPKRESNGITPDSKVSMARIRRLSEPKTITSPAVTSIKPQSAESLSKRKFSEGPERNKTSTIINLDRSKAASLPELKIKTSRAHSSTGGNESAVIDKKRVNGTKPSSFSKNSELNVNNSNGILQMDADENPIVEKTVVMLEYEKPSLPILHSTLGKLETGNQQYNDRDKGEKSVVISKLAALPAPPTKGVENDTIPCQPQNLSDFNEVKAHGKQASTNLDTRVEEIVKTHVPDSRSLKVDQNSGTLEKIPVKEPSKGFKRLLKFGKKNHTSSVDQSADDCKSVDGTEYDANARNAASSSEVHTLKNLISVDETYTSGSASQKSASRHFSLLPPFWSKTTEKKQAS